MPPSRSSRRRTWVAAGLCLAATLAAPATAHGYTTTPLTIDVVVGPRDDTRCTIDADLYRPAGVSRRRPAPAILATNGFGGDKTGLAEIAGSYAQRGYVFLAYSGLGFGGSDCPITLDDPDWDGKAGQQLVTFLGGGKTARDGTRVDYVRRDRRAHDRRRHRYDPRVGMLNGSYGGQVQFAIAGRDPRVDVISPLNTWNDLAYSLAPNSTDIARGVTSRTPGVMKADWPAAFFAVGAAGGATTGGTCPGFHDWVCPGLVGATATGFPDASTIARLRHASVSSYIRRIRIPVLLTQGQHDTLFDLRESVATYEALRARRIPTALVWASAGHSGGSLGTAEYDPGNPAGAYSSRIEQRWMDHYLRGTGRRPPLGFSFFRDWVAYKDDAAPAVATVPRYPAGRQRSWYLSGGDALVSDSGSARSGSAPMAAVPAPTGTGGGIVDLGAHDAPGTAVSFTSPPLERDTDVVGVPRVTVTLSAPVFAAAQGTGPAGKLVLFAKLLDVGPDGSTAVLPKNLVAAARVPDVTRPVPIELPGIVHRFRRGHRLRLTLSTSSAAFRGNTLAGSVAVETGRGRAARLTLPVHDGAAGRR